MKKLNVKLSVWNNKERVINIEDPETGNRLLDIPMTAQQFADFINQVDVIKTEAKTYGDLK